MCFAALGAFVGSLLMGQMADAYLRTQQETMPSFMRLIVKLFPILAVAQIGTGMLAMYAGYHFLNLKPWARTFLEGFSWFFVVFILGFGLFSVYMMTTQHVPPKFAIFEAVMAVASISVYGIPIGIILKFLRGKTVRDAMIYDTSVGSYASHEH